MIVIMQNNASSEQVKTVENELIQMGFKTHHIIGEYKTVIGAIGNKSDLDAETVKLMDGVENIVPIMKPYKLVGRELKHEDTIVKVGNIQIGGKEIVVMAGPCAVETEQQLYDSAEAVKSAGAKILRGGAFKPRTSPYAFQGLEEDGLKILEEARNRTGLKVVTEVIDTRDVELVAKYADILQIGARNMQNFRLLHEAGLSGKPVLLKRGMSSTIEEWLMAAEYVLAAGNPNVILCERGIRTYETAVRNTLDLSAIPIAKELSHLPVVVDPSHASGTYKYVAPLSKGAIAIGADGLIIEVHKDPCIAKCDGPQSLKPKKFEQLMNELKPIAEAVGRSI